MPDYSRTRTLSQSPEKLFNLLASSGNMAHYLPAVKSASTHLMGNPTSSTKVFRGHAAVGIDVISASDSSSTAVMDRPQNNSRCGDGGGSWFKVNADDRRIDWGGGEEYPYRGELQVHPVGRGAYVTLHVHTEVFHPDLDAALEESLDHIAELAT